jgi:hypothetical protein
MSHTQITIYKVNGGKSIFDWEKEDKIDKAQALKEQKHYSEYKTDKSVYRLFKEKKHKAEVRPRTVMTKLDKKDLTIFKNYEIKKNRVYNDILPPPR